MERHVPQLSTCKKLKELGYPQDLDNNAYVWARGLNTDKIVLCSWDYAMPPEIAAAPLATELLEWLNNNSTLETWNLDNDIRIRHTLLGCETRTGTLVSDFKSEKESFVEALAQMLIYLVENNIVKFEKAGTEEHE